MSAWKKLMCTKEKVFVRYNVAIPITSGVNAPHFRTSQTLCRLSSQNNTIAPMITRVNNGSRKMYDRARWALNPDIVDGGIARVKRRPARSSPGADLADLDRWSLEIGVRKV